MGKKAKKAAAAKRLSDKRGLKARNQTLYQDRARQGQNTLSKRQKLNAKRSRKVRANRNRAEAQYPGPKMNDPLNKFLRFGSGPQRGQVKRELTAAEIAALQTKPIKPKKWYTASEKIGYLSRVRSGK